MERVISSNGLRMIKNQKYWWRVNNKYADGTGDEFYTISVGNLGEMYNILYNTETNWLSISQIGYSYDWVVRFAVDFNKCDEMVDAFMLPLDMEMMPLYLNPNPKK